MVQQGPSLPSLSIRGASDNTWLVEKSHQEEEVPKVLSGAQCHCFEVIAKDKPLYWKYKAGFFTALPIIRGSTEVLHSSLVHGAKARRPLTESKRRPSLPTLFLVPDLTERSLCSLLPGGCWPWPGRHSLLSPAVMHYLRPIIHQTVYTNKFQLVGCF